MIIVALFGFATLIGLIFLVAMLDEHSSAGERMGYLFWGLAFLGVGVAWPVNTGYQVRGEEEMTFMLFLGDWLRGALHLQSQAMEWLKESTGF